jgi:hypothetical protein
LERELLEPQKLGEEEFDGRIEYPIRVTDIQGNIQFLRLFTFLLNYLENECKPAEFSMSIVLETKNFFTVPFWYLNIFKYINYLF